MFSKRTRIIIESIWLTCVGLSFGFEYVVVTELLRAAR